MRICGIIDFYSIKEIFLLIDKDLFQLKSKTDQRPGCTAGALVFGEFYMKRLSEKCFVIPVVAFQQIRCVQTVWAFGGAPATFYALIDFCHFPLTCPA